MSRDAAILIQTIVSGAGYLGRDGRAAAPAAPAAGFAGSSSLSDTTSKPASRLTSGIWVVETVKIPQRRLWRLVGRLRFSKLLPSKPKESSFRLLGQLMPVPNRFSAEVCCGKSRSQANAPSQGSLAIHGSTLARSVPRSSAPDLLAKSRPLSCDCVHWKSPRFRGCLGN